MPISQIERVMGISRNTVKAALASDGPPKYRRSPAGSVADAFEPRVRELLKSYPSMPHRITVNAVIPGLVNTVLTRHEDRYAQALSDGGAQPSGDIDRDEPTATKALASKSPLGVPWIEPEDVAPLVVFLASDQARMVSGTSFAATAGDSARVTA
jgi:hypothetical protein